MGALALKSTIIQAKGLASRAESQVIAMHLPTLIWSVIDDFPTCLTIFDPGPKEASLDLHARAMFINGRDEDRQRVEKARITNAVSAAPFTMRLIRVAGNPAERYAASGHLRQLFLRDDRRMLYLSLCDLEAEVAERQHIWLHLTQTGKSFSEIVKLLKTTQNNLGGGMNIDSRDKGEGSQGVGLSVGLMQELSSDSLLMAVADRYFQDVARRIIIASKKGLLSRDDKDWHALGLLHCEQRSHAALLHLGS